jgi:hypothetical protein
MQMGAHLVQAFAGVPHDAELLALLNALAFLDCDRAQVAIEAVVFAAVKIVFDHDILAIVRMTRRMVRVHHHARADCPHRID